MDHDRHDAAEFPAARPVPPPDLPFTRHRLANGLTLIVHEDRSTPLIAVELRFNVGSKDEPPGRFGFAHLFEHLMFRESANRRESWHVRLAELGGSNVNATTSYDRTNYYQTVPTGAIDTLLWMESDRMGHLLEGLTAEALAAEVEVVKNEKRQREAAPLGSLAETIAGILYPVGHPYGHAVIGTVEDLDRATLETAHDWYRRWYGAGNAVLVMAGDIAPDEALAKVEHWFGDLPKGPPIRRARRWLPPRQGAQQLQVEDRVANPGLVRIWTIPAYGDPDTIDLGFVAAALTGAPDALLTRQLVEVERLCVAVEASIERRYLNSEFCISVTFAPGADEARVTAIIDVALAGLLADGPEQVVIDRTLRGGRLAMLRALESLSLKAEILAGNQTEFGSPDAFRGIDEVASQATAERIAAAARRWLTQDMLTINVLPYADAPPPIYGPDRSCAPTPAPVTAPRFPGTETATLTNGIPVTFAHRPGSTTVSTMLLFEDGTAADPPGDEGLTNLAVGLLTAGTQTKDGDALAEWQRRINTAVSTTVTAETVGIRCDGLPGDYDVAAMLLADVALHPAYAERDIALAASAAQNAIASERLSPDMIARQASAALVFGVDHPLARRAGGTRASLDTLDAARLHARHLQLLRHGAASLHVVGDLAMQDVAAALEPAFADWRPHMPANPPLLAALDPRPGRYFIAREGMDQSIITVSVADPDFGRRNMCGPAMTIFSMIVGEAFGSRLNRNLRERRGWTYGVSSGFSRWRDVGVFSIQTTVQGERTREALAEIERELAGLVGPTPITAQELEHARQSLVREMPGHWAETDTVLAALIERHRYALQAGHFDYIVDRLHAVTLADLKTLAERCCVADRSVALVVGNPHRFDIVGLSIVEPKAGGSLSEPT